VTKERKDNYLLN